MALGVAHVLKARTILVMCPSHIAKKWAREAIKTIPFARTFLVEDMRNGGDPKQAHGVCEVRVRKGRIAYEGIELSLAELRQLGRNGWRQRCPQCSVFSLDSNEMAFRTFDPDEKVQIFLVGLNAGDNAYGWCVLSDL
jgi:hypothetical protein